MIKISEAFQRDLEAAVLSKLAAMDKNLGAFSMGEIGEMSQKVNRMITKGAPSPQVINQAMPAAKSRAKQLVAKALAAALPAGIAGGYLANSFGSISELLSKILPHL